MAKAGAGAGIGPDDALCLPFVGAGSAPIEWRLSDVPVDYPTALDWMETRATAIAQGQAKECVWLLEHPPLYTAGTSAQINDLTDPNRFPVYRAGRGGQYTYHGPGQRVAYVMLNLDRRRRDIRCFVYALEAWLIASLAEFGIRGERRKNRVGIWVDRGSDGFAGREDKIAAIGVRLRRWVSLHGISLNVDPDLEHFEGIVPCGIAEHGITSLVDLGHPVSLADADAALRRSWEPVFGRVA